MYIKHLTLVSMLLDYWYVFYYWASEASPTLGCSIEISRDICYSYAMGSRGISARVTRAQPECARAFIPIYPVSNHGISILYPD